MRELLFRGKRNDNGEWVQGDLIQINNGRKFIVNNKHGACIDNKGNFINTEAPFVCEIFPDTVGQFTGLTDLDGIKIFEGDIVLYGLYPCAIKYDAENARFMFYKFGTEITNGFNVDDMKKRAVVGNVYDNPKLLLKWGG